MPWLMKAEPDSRIVKGKDVKFSVDDFEEIGTSPWDGVRNHEAKNIMKDKMKLGDKVLFYHSNCKTPGVFALAEVAKEGYPDYTAWDPSHPYYDPKSSEAKPTWYMVNVRFVRRLAHPVTLAFIKSLVPARTPPAGVAYIGAAGLAAIQAMALVNRGRLSVQPVEDAAYDAIVALGDRGGWDEGATKGKGKAATKQRDTDEDAAAPAATKRKAGGAAAASKAAPTKKSRALPASASPSLSPPPPGDDSATPPAKTKAARKAPRPKAEPKPAAEGTRRSTRVRK